MLSGWNQTINQLLPKPWYHLRSSLSSLPAANSIEVSLPSRYEMFQCNIQIIQCQHLDLHSPEKLSAAPGCIVLLFVFSLIQYFLKLCLTWCSFKKLVHGLSCAVKKHADSWALSKDQIHKQMMVSNVSIPRVTSSSCNEQNGKRGEKHLVSTASTPLCQ